MIQKLTAKSFLNIAGTVLGVAATIVTGIASQKAMKEEVAKQIAEQKSSTEE